MPDPSEFIVQDFGDRKWTSSLKSIREFDLIISGYSIHHIDNASKRRLYNDIYKLLRPGGIFLNLEHVSSPAENLEQLFHELFDDGMMDYQEYIGDPKTREEIDAIYNDPEHRKMNLLESVEKQCGWLRENGFKEVDCYIKIFELALFGGMKPDS